MILILNVVLELREEFRAGKSRTEIVSASGDWNCDKKSNHSPVNPCKRRYSELFLGLL